MSVAVEHTKLSLLLKDCAKGFYQQMYFLGKDVIHPQGNQLQTYGFIKSASQGLKGTSCYTHQRGSTEIELYGSCAALYTDTVSMVFLRKRCRFYRWLPEQKLVAGQWSQSDIELADSSTMLQSITPLLQWWVEYEKWIEERMGKNYREQCFTQWGKVQGKAAWLAPAVATDWVMQFLQEKGKHVRPKDFA